VAGRIRLGGLVDEQDLQRIGRQRDAAAVVGDEVAQLQPLAVEDQLVVG
jgi:hypothetical protein